MEQPDFTDQIFRETTYPPEEEFPVASESAKDLANKQAIFLSYYTNIVPYFDVALDEGVDIYYDYEGDELHIHVPPDGSRNFYIFTRINVERKVTRLPDHREPHVVIIEYLEQLGHNKIEE